MPEIVEGQIYPDKLRKMGSSYYLLVSPESLAYLGIEKPDEQRIVVKADKGKHGRFLGFGKPAKGQ